MRRRTGDDGGIIKTGGYSLMMWRTEIHPAIGSSGYRVFRKITSEGAASAIGYAKQPGDYRSGYEPRLELLLSSQVLSDFNAFPGIHI
jgi:hypothetical protein